MSTIARLIGCGLAVLVLLGCQSGTMPARWTIEKTLDDFHDAAALADGPRYFSHLADEAVFIGTDPTERWTRDEFITFCRPYFDAGRGWRYVPLRREVRVADGGRLAWFDELLSNEKYGVCRGVGVVRRTGDRWAIEQYALSLTVPNELAEEVVAITNAGE